MYFCLTRFTAIFNFQKFGVHIKDTPEKQIRLIKVNPLCARIWRQRVNSKLPFWICSPAIFGHVSQWWENADLNHSMVNNSRVVKLGTYVENAPKQVSKRYHFGDKEVSRNQTKTSLLRSGYETYRAHWPLLPFACWHVNRILCIWRAGSSNLWTLDGFKGFEGLRIVLW